VENRCRLAVEVIKAVHAACGSDFPVLVRWSPIDYVPGGNELASALQIAPLLEQAGAAWHNLQIGWHESSIPLTIKTIPDGYWSWISAELKKVAKIPVVTAYRETDPYVMERIIADGKADIIGGARYCLADPAFARKATEDRPEDIGLCICCCRCLDDVVSKELGLEYCSVNPRLGAELERPLGKTAAPRKVMVIGSGPGGLAAAVTAYKRGHDVTICERGPRIGGCLTMSAIFSPMYERLTNYYKTILRKNPDIKVRLNAEMTAEKVLYEKADAVIVATGGYPLDSPVPAAEPGKVVRSHDFLELLNGKPPQKPGLLNKFMWNAGGVFLRLFYSPQLIKRLLRLKWPFGKRVGIIGGGLPGCELAVELLDNHREIFVTDAHKKIGYDVGASERFHVTSKLKKSPHALLVPESEVTEIGDGFIRGRRADGSVYSHAVDTVAITLGFTENMALAQSLKGRVPVLHAIGDCTKPARMADATKAGYLAALELG
jgi:2,4-dienoyl-CoA reductase (NADPH2)